MSFRNEEKLRVASGKIFQLKEWINANNGLMIYPTRIINSLYFDNKNYSMYNESIEGITPRKKIRLRSYDKEFILSKRVNKEIKITSVEGRYKISEKATNPSDLVKLGIYDHNYGLCLPVLNVLYERSYYKIKNARLTIDKKIIYKNFTNGKISKFSTFDNFNIVELKYSSSQSVNNISKNFPFDRTRFSKYCRGIEFIRLNYCNEI